MVDLIIIANATPSIFGCDALARACGLAGAFCAAAVTAHRKTPPAKIAHRSNLVITSPLEITPPVPDDHIAILGQRSSLSTNCCSAKGPAFRVAAQASAKPKVEAQWQDSKHELIVTG
jgi:hypothetical protein